MTQNNLGAAWSDLPTGDRAANIMKAIECYEAAIEVFSVDEFPRDHGIVSRNLKLAKAELDELP